MTTENQIDDDSSQTEIRYILILGSKGIYLGGFKDESQFYSGKVRNLLQAGITNRVLAEKLIKQTIKGIKYLFLDSQIESNSTKIIGFATAWANTMICDGFFSEIKSETGIVMNIINQQIEGDIGVNVILKETIIGWDIGKEIMQFMRQNQNTDEFEVIRSAYSLALNREESFVDTLILLAMNRAKEIVNESFHSFHDAIQSKNCVVFGIGHIHKTVRVNVNELLGKNHLNFYTITELEQMTKLSVKWNNNSDVRNICFILGFMKYLGIEKIFTINYREMVGIFLKK